VACTNVAVAVDYQLSSISLFSLSQSTHISIHVSSDVHKTLQPIRKRRPSLQRAGSDTQPKETDPAAFPAHPHTYSSTTRPVRDPAQTA
jgi:hypothetical protein